MGLLKVIRLWPILLFVTMLGAKEIPSTCTQILFSMHRGDIAQAIELYLDHFQKEQQHDFELLQQMGLSLLDKGCKSPTPENQLLTLLGAGISGNEKAYYILEEGLRNPVPQLQLIALSLLTELHDDRVGLILETAMKSDHLLIRLEALSYLAELKHPKATPHIESLMNKIPEELHSIFPPLLAVSGDAAAIKTLRKLLSHYTSEVRVAAIHSIARANRDDLLPTIRLLATQQDIAQLEACSYALGVLGDKTSLSRLTVLAKSNQANVRLAALQALLRLGQLDRRLEIEQMALMQNPFAINILGEFEEAKSILYSLMKKGSLQTRINSCLSLLALRDTRCLESVNEILIRDSRDLAFSKIHSVGLGLRAWKAVPNTMQMEEEGSLVKEISLSMREDVLGMCMNLPEKEFLKIAELLFESQQNDLIPALTEGLEKMESEATIALLKKYSSKAGAPLIRQSCNLALFNLKQAGPYENDLRQWVTHRQEDDLIKLRPIVPLEARDEMAASYSLTPQESSRLLIRAFEVFAKSQEDRGIDLLLQAILHGNPNNRFVLAGLLIRACE